MIKKIKLLKIKLILLDTKKVYSIYVILEAFKKIMICFFWNIF